MKKKAISLVKSNRSAWTLGVLLVAGVLSALNLVSARPVRAATVQEEPPQIDDGLTDEEREFINRPITGMSDEDKQRRDQILAKMRDHIIQVMNEKEQAKQRPAQTPKTSEQPVEPADQPATTPKTRPETPKRTQRKPGERKPPTPKRGTQAPQTQTLPGQAPTTGTPATFMPPTPEAQPPVEPEGNAALAFDQRLYSFGMKNGSYIDLVEMFARKTGLPVLGLPVKPIDPSMRPEDSALSYVSAELTDFRTTMHQINDLLFFQVSPPLYLYYDAKEKRLKLDMFKELRFRLPPSRMFTSLEAVEAAVQRAELMTSDIVRVFFTPKSESAMKVFNEIVAGMFGEQVLMSLIPESGRVDFTGRVDILRTVDEYMMVFKDFETGENTVHVIPLQHIRPSEAVDKLIDLVPNVIASSTEIAAPASSRRAKGAAEDPGLLLESEKVLVIADDARKVLLVKGLPYKVNEIKDMLPFIDRQVAKDETDLPLVIKLRHAQADMVVEQLNAIVNGGPAGAAAASRPKRGRQNQPAEAPAATGSDALRAIADQRSNSVILQGPQELLTLAQKIVEEILDVETADSDYRIVMVEHGNAQDIVDDVNELMGGGKPEQRAGEEALNMIASGNKILIKGPPVKMSEAEGLIKVFDVREEDRPQMFVAQVKNVPASTVVEVLKLQEGAAAAGAEGGKRPKGRAALPGGARFHADDAIGAIYFHGTQREWENEIKPVIAMVDGQPVDPHKLTFLKLEHADPDTVVGQLATLFPDGGGGRPKGGAPSAGARFTSSIGGIIVGGEVTAAQLSSIREAVAMLDTARDEMETRTFALQYADPETVAEKIQDLFSSPGAAAAPRRGRAKGGEAPPSPTGEPVAMKIATTLKGLIVIAPRADMQTIADMVARFDEQDVADAKVESRPFAIQHAQADVVAALIEPMLQAKMAEGAPGQPAGEKGKTPRAAEAALSVEVDARTNTVWVTAAQPIVEYAALLVNQVDDKRDEKTKVLKIYDCVNSSAEDLAVILTTMYGGEGGGVKAPAAPKVEGKPEGSSKKARDRIARLAGDSGPRDLEILPLPGDKAISIHGPVDLVQQVVARAAELDAKSAASENVSRTFTLKWADVEEVADAIIAMLDEPAGRAAAAPAGKAKAGEETAFSEPISGPKSGKQISVWPKYETGTLIVYAPPAKMVAIESLIAECERLADPDNDLIEPVAEPFETYPLKYLSAFQALKIAEETIKKVYPTSPPVTLDYLNNTTLVLSGTRKYFAQISDLISQHVDTQEMADRIPTVVSVKPIPAQLSQDDLRDRLKSIATDVDIEFQDLSQRPGEIHGGSIQEIE